MRRIVVAIFFGPHGLRSGWRVTFFLVLAVVLALALSVVRPRIAGLDLRILPGELCQALAAAVATWIMARLDGRQFSSYGLASAGGGRNFAAGSVVGFAALSLLIGLLSVSGVYHFGAPALTGTAALKWAIYWLATFAVVGLSEEMLSRGYPMFALAEGIGIKPAALIVALLFGLGHLGNGGEQIFGIGNAVLAGLAFAYSVHWSGSLWWAIGAHMSWDWAETFFYGTADSGGTAQHHFFSAYASGPAWLSGGSVGPEGSVLCTAVLALMAAAVRVTAPYRPPTYAPSEIPPPASSPSISPSMYSAGSGDTNSEESGDPEQS
jgi:uncharacterized protein